MRLVPPEGTERHPYERAWCKKCLEWKPNQEFRVGTRFEPLGWCLRCERGRDERKRVERLVTSGSGSVADEIAAAVRAGGASFSAIQEALSEKLPELIAGLFVAASQGDVAAARLVLDLAGRQKAAPEDEPEWKRMQRTSPEPAA